jgi:hypothetical protein
VNLKFGLQPQDKLSGASIWPLTSGSELETCGAFPSRTFSLRVAPRHNYITYVILAVCLEFLARPKMVCCGGGAGEAGAWSGRHPHQSVPARRVDRSSARLRLSASPGESLYKHTVHLPLTETQVRSFLWCDKTRCSLVDGYRVPDYTAAHPGTVRF